jgi:hypothetical protein
VTGGTASQNYPTTPTAFDPMFNGATDVFVTKLNPAGNALVYSTFIGNDPDERGDSIAVDAAGCAFVTGVTSSAGYPVTAGAFDMSFNGATDAFVTKLNPAGSALIYSTFLGRGNDEIGEGIAIDPFGMAYVAGTTRSPGFPMVGGSFDTVWNGGRDVFVTKLNPAGAGLVYSTFVGGNGHDNATDIAVATAGAIFGQAYVTGYTRSANFPVTGGAFDMAANGNSDAYVTTLNAAGAALVYSTYLGGAADDFGRAIVLDGNGSANITGGTMSGNFPTTAGTIDPSFNGGIDAFASRFDGAGAALLFSTYYGTMGDDAGNGVALGFGNIFVVGYTTSAALPTTAGSVQPVFGGVRDAFVAQLQP